MSQKYLNFTDEEFETELKLKCPTVFSLLNVPRKEHVPAEPIQFGLETDKGWRELVMECGLKLESLNDGTVAVQVKQKLGGLRFYVGSSSDTGFAIIREAEIKADTTCEYCGKPGKVKSDRGWLRVLCPECGKQPVLTITNSDDS
jgi:hypothetical protein